MKISAVCLPSFFLPATFALLLAACASTPPATPLAPPHAPITTTPEAAKTPLPSIHPEPSNIAKRPGGYYKDDGPGDNPPPNLGDIPNAQPRVEALNRYANRPYVALGQSYSPRQQVVPFVERGLASWYGKRFQGVRTSSGEPYDMYAMTAAHPTLPIPSYARVTNLENGRSVIVRINDRGPFHKDRIMDLSYTAAWKLGYVDKGSAQVEVEAIVPGDATEAADGSATAIAAGIPPIHGPSESDTKTSSNDVPGQTADTVSTSEIPTDEGANNMPLALTMVSTYKTEAAAHGIFLQLGVFASSRNAESFRDYVQTELKWLTENVEIFIDGDRFRLYAGPFDNLQASREAAEHINRTIKLKPFVVQR